MKRKILTGIMAVTICLSMAVPAAAAPANGTGCAGNYVDADGDGICDNFADADQDGICDHCTGTGRRGNKRGQYAAGKNGRGACGNPARNGNGRGRGCGQGRGRL